MTPEHIHDALNYLPDDLLEATDALRQKKRIPWRSVTAVAACACLAVGLWLFFPGATAMDNATESDQLEGENYHSESSTAEFITALVVEVEADRIWVTTVEANTAIPVLLEGLEEIPALEAGQWVHIYCQETDGGAGETGGTEHGLKPYKIEVEEN